MSVDRGGKPHVTRSAFSFTGSPIPTPCFAVISTIPTQSCDRHRQRSGWNGQTMATYECRHNSLMTRWKNAEGELL